MFFLALFICRMFISFWKSIYLTIVSLLLVSSNSMYTPRGQVFGLFWSVTRPLKILLPLKYRDDPRMEAAFPSSCCIQVVSFNSLNNEIRVKVICVPPESLALRRDYLFPNLLLPSSSSWLWKIRIHLGIPISLDLQTIAWVWPLQLPTPLTQPSPSCQ